MGGDRVRSDPMHGLLGYSALLDPERMERAEQSLREARQIATERLERRVAAHEEGLSPLQRFLQEIGLGRVPERIVAYRQELERRYEHDSAPE